MSINQETDATQKDFEEGFAGKAILSTARAKAAAAEAEEDDKDDKDDKDEDPSEAEETAVEATEEAKAAEKATGDEHTEAVETPKPKKTARLSAEEIDSLRALAAKVPEQDKQLSKAFGTIGKLQQQLNGMKTAADEKAAEKPNEPKQPEKVLTPAEKEIEKRIREIAIEELDDRHPDWRNIVDASPTPDPEKPFRKWLATRTPEYQKKVNNTNSAGVIARAIDLFKESTAPKKAPPKSAQPGKAKPAVGVTAMANARRDRIANSIPPKTAGLVPARSKTLEDSFKEGFASG